MNFQYERDASRPHRERDRDGRRTFEGGPYSRFGTPNEEIRKFRRRLIAIGISQCPRNANVVELFGGRGGLGNGLEALAQLGFRHIEGVDLS